MNIINCSPFQNDACQYGGQSQRCCCENQCCCESQRCCCENQCGCGCSQPYFTPTPEIPFPCAACSNERPSCGSKKDCACEALALLESPCYGLGTLRSELCDVRYTVDEIYKMLAPVPVHCSCCER